MLWLFPSTWSIPHPRAPIAAAAGLSASPNTAAFRLREVHQSENMAGTQDAARFPELVSRRLWQQQRCWTVSLESGVPAGQGTGHVAS